MLIKKSLSVCFEPPPLQHGKYSGPDLPKSGSIYQYVCNQGFKLSPSSSRYATCTKNGTYKWDYKKTYPEYIQSLFNSII